MGYVLRKIFHITSYITLFSVLFRLMHRNIVFIAYLLS